jgi:hypothetical protein
MLWSFILHKRCIIYDILVFFSLNMVLSCLLHMRAELIMHKKVIFGQFAFIIKLIIQLIYFDVFCLH